MTVFNSDKITMTKYNQTLDNINDKMKGEHEVVKIRGATGGSRREAVAEGYNSNTLDKYIHFLKNK